MSTSIGNTKVYQFLARTQRNKDDWQTYVDSEYGNNDGIISNKEFYEFIKAEYQVTMGEKLSNSDFNIFWSTVDTDTVEFSNKRGIKVDGAFNLNAKEIDAMNAQMEDYLNLDDVCRLAEDNNKNLFEKGDDFNQWKSMVATLLATELETWRANGRKGGNFYDYMTKTNVERFAAIQIEATVKVQKDNVLEEWYGDENLYWDDLASLQPPYNILEDEDIAVAINNLLKKYINNATEITVDDIPTLLTKIRGEVNDAITAVLNQKGLNEKGEPIQVPVLDDNGEPKVDENGDPITSDILTEEHVQAFTVQLYELLESEDFLTAIPENHKGYENIYKEAGKTWINNKIKDLRSDESNNNYDSFKNAIDQIKAEDIINELKEDTTIQNTITAEINKENSKNNIIQWLNSGVLQDTLFATKSSDPVNNIIERLKNSSFMNDIISYVNTNFDEFYEKTKNGGIMALQGYITSYAKEEFARAVGNACQSGMNIDGFDATTLVNSLEYHYGFADDYADNFTNEADKRYYYAQLTVGHLWDIYNAGFGDAIDAVFGNDKWQEVDIWANYDKTYMDERLKEVHNKMIELADKTQQSGGTGEPEGAEESEDGNIETPKVPKGKTNIDDATKLGQIYELSGEDGVLRTDDYYKDLPGAKRAAKNLVESYVNEIKNELTNIEKYDGTAVAAAATATTSWFHGIIGMLVDKFDNSAKDNGWYKDDCITDTFEYTDGKGVPQNGYAKYKEVSYNKSDYGDDFNSACGVTLFRNDNGWDYSGWQIIIEKSAIADKFKEFFNQAIS